MSRLTNFNELISIKQIGVSKLLQCNISYAALDSLLSQYNDPMIGVHLLKIEFEEALKAYLSDTLGEVPDEIQSR